ncbi:hypothetical protein [Streptomyces aureus]|uniref:hypothetical protein n=1 Tax=Streptomyces aureus TaxID=193461 RepID=UPI0006E2FD36|nr:hypothetical protein [Streptomyces aureus]
MNLGTVAGSATSLVSGRFLLVGYLPTCAGSFFLLSLVWAGAPNRPPAFRSAWKAATTLGVGEILMLFLLLLVVAVLFHPLQLSVVKFLEGYWPSRMSALTTYGVRRQNQRRSRLSAGTALTPGGPPAPSEVRRAGLALIVLRQSFPSESGLTRPTRLGNTLAAAEDRAGRPYGWDAPVAWPRLYPLLADPVRIMVDNRRDMLDAMVRLSVTGLVCGIGSTVLLAPTGWWVMLSAAPLFLARLAYGAAVAAALSYGEALRVAFDLHRFDLYSALRIDLPATRDEERQVNTTLCDFWRQGRDLGQDYTHPVATADATSLSLPAPAPGMSDLGGSANTP